MVASLTMDGCVSRPHLPHIVGEMLKRRTSITAASTASSGAIARSVHVVPTCCKLKALTLLHPMDTRSHRSLTCADVERGGSGMGSSQSTCDRVRLSDTLNRSKIWNLRIHTLFFVTLSTPPHPSPPPQDELVVKRYETISPGTRLAC